MVQAVQLSPVCRSRRKIGRPVATMVPSSEDMNSAIETIPKTSQGLREVLGFTAVTGRSGGEAVGGPARTAPSARSGGGPGLRAAPGGRVGAKAARRVPTALKRAGGRVIARRLPVRAVPVSAPNIGAHCHCPNYRTEPMTL